MMIEDQNGFSKWLDTQLSEKIPQNIIAFNINIYESPFSIEIVGSKEFTESNDDWTCNEDWVPNSRMMQVSNELFGSSWQEAEENIYIFAYNFYQQDWINSKKLKQAQAFGIGFVDGNLRYVS